MMGPADLYKLRSYIPLLADGFICLSTGELLEITSVFLGWEPHITEGCLKRKLGCGKVRPLLGIGGRSRQNRSSPVISFTPGGVRWFWAFDQEHGDGPTVFHASPGLEK